MDMPETGKDVRQGGTSAGARVSVVIPAYNVAPYLGETLDSVFAQTVPAYEVIVVNDGSPDTPELERVLAPYRDRIVYLIQENRGLSGARNTAIAAATGDYIALLDGDDLWLPQYIERQTAYLRGHPGVDLVYCNALFFGDSQFAGMAYMEVCPSAGEPTAAALISRQCHVFVSVMARAAVMKELRFDESLRSCEDFDCWLRLTAGGYRMGYHREVLVRYRKHLASLSADPTWMAQTNLKVLDRAQGLWPPEAIETRLLRDAKERKAAELENIRGKLALARNDVATAAAHLERANAFYRSTKVRIVLASMRFAPWLVRSLFTLRGSLVRSYRDSN